MINYEQDFYAWIFENAQLLREGRYSELDVANVIEELEGLARSDKREANERIGNLLSHLLKWQLRPQQRRRRWERAIHEERFQLRLILADSPTLQAKLSTELAEIYAWAVIKASYETRLVSKRFPSTCPYTLEQILADDFYPENEISPST